MEFWQKQESLMERLKDVRQVMQDAIPLKGRLPAIARAQVENEGKMLRPALLLLSAGLSTKPAEAASAAAALEYFHIASLIHDDIVDQAEKRRGRPTVAAQYGISLALYTGDYLIWLAVKCLSGLDGELLPDQLMDFMSPILEAEIEQLENRYSTGITEEGYLKRIEAKTGLLFGYGAAAGTALRSGDWESSEKMRRAGLDLGVAFQLRDDLEDLLSPLHPDLKEGNYTYPVLMAMKKDRGIVSLLERARTEDSLSLYDRVVERSLAAGGREDTEKKIALQLEKAEGVFMEYLGEPEREIYQWMTRKLYGGTDGKKSSR